MKESNQNKDNNMNTTKENTAPISDDNTPVSCNAAEYNQFNTDYHLGEGTEIIDGKLFRTVEYSKTEQTHLLMSRHMNGAGRLFGGKLLAWLDEMAGIVAKRHSGHEIITACIDNLEFKNGCYLNDLVVLIGYITHVGRSSMEVRIDTYVEKPDGSRRPINRAFFVMVALDEFQKPIEVPRLKITSMEQQAKWDAAIRRSELRKQRKIEGY